jgi:hypothetical protein
MNRSLRRSALVAFAAVLFAAPAFAQKTGATSVIEVEKPAKTAVQIHYDCAAQQCTTAYQVPAGMRLVVESLLGKLSSASSTPLGITVDTTLNGIFEGETWMFSRGSLQMPQYFVYPFAESVRMYSDTTPGIVPTNWLYSSTDTLSLFGYLVKK